MEVGFLYKLEHSMLPAFVLGQIGHVRAVMVCEKEVNSVTVSFPSKRSLEKFFGKDENGVGRKSTWLMEPNLDLIYTMNLNLAETVLCNRIPFEEFAARRGTRSFWMNESPFEEVDNSVNGGIELAKWGLRKRVTFVRKQRENNENPLSVEVEAMKEEEEEDEEYDEEEGRRGSARKRKNPNKYVEKNKKKKKRGPVEVGISKGDEYNDPTSEANFRWTKERYKKAEKNILKIMKYKEAFHGNPILRADLRTEARRLIGDTGLLDHLLKHMAGKIAPGGKERFRRRHNPNGAMEYWLESADLVSIRKEAGVDDPYWIPPEGWKLGDSPTQDPVCALELKKLRQDVDMMRSEIQELANKQLGIGKVVGDVPTCLDDVEKRRKSLLMPLKAMEEDLLRRKAKIEEQLLNVAKALTDMEEDLGGLVVETSPTGSRGAINEHAGEICKEDKTARRQRLKSGFKICKPHGTFLWPADVATSGASFSTLDDFLAASSPCSVGSSRSALAAPPPPPPQFAVLKPVAKKPSLVGLSDLASPTTTAASSVKSVFVPDLNEAPLLDGLPANLDSPSGPIQVSFGFYPSGGTRAPISMVIGSDIPARAFQAADPAPPLLYTPQVQREMGISSGADVD